MANKDLIQRLQGGGLSNDDILQLFSPPGKKTTKKEGSERFIPLLTSILGGILGTPLGPAGIIGGAALGGSVGKGTQQKVSGKKLNAKEIVKEGAISGASSVAGLGLGKALQGLGLLGRGAGKVGAEAGVAVGEGGNMLTSLGKSLGKGAVKPQVPSGIGSIAAEDKIVSGLQNLGIKGTPNQMRVQIADLDKSLNTEIGNILSKETKTLSNKEVSNLFNKAISSTDAFDAADPLYQRLTQRTVNRFLGSGKQFTAQDIFNIKKTLNGELGKAFDKLSKGGNLTPAEEVKMVLRSNLDDYIATKFPAVKQQTLQQAFLRDAVPGIEKAASTTAKLPLLGIPLPGVAQVGQTAAGRVGAGIGQFGRNAASPLTLQALGLTQGAAQAGARPGLLDEEGQESFDEFGDMDPGFEDSGNGLATEGSAQSEALLTNEDMAEIMLTDLAETGGKNIPELKAIFEYLGPPKAAKKPTGAQAKDIANAQSGLEALNTLEREISRNPGVILKSKVPGSPGARVFVAARNEAQDVLSRLRTGAALTKTEENFYKRQLPNAFDDAATIKYKLGIFKNLFARIIDQAASEINVPNSSEDQTTDILKQLGL